MRKALVILACVCAIAYAQIESEDQTSLQKNEEAAIEESSDPVESSDFSSSVNEASDLGEADSDSVVDDSISAVNDDRFGGRGYSETTTVNYDSVVVDNKEDSAIYENNANQYEQLSGPRPVSSRTCIEKNERYTVSGSCDRYIECLNGTAEEKVCPDGLRYNHNVKFNVDPCQYPIDVPCLGRSTLQPPQPTADCPHQFGYFRSGDRSNCSGFRNCVHGVGYDFQCPEGLAFSSDTYRCEWPDLVKDCDAEAFLGFRCPEVPVAKEFGPPAGFRFYRSSSDCQKYFICIDGRPRRLACGGYTAFDELTETCVSADEVSSCSAELKTRATRARDEEKQRQERQERVLKFPYNKPEKIIQLGEAEPEARYETRTREEPVTQEVELREEYEQEVQEPSLSTTEFPQATYVE